MKLKSQAVLFCLACATVAAQTPDPTDPLQHGSLVVWFVGSPGPAPGPQPYTQYHEQTAGSFGTVASDIGQTAGSYGRPASTLPTVAPSKPASEVGQTAGSFGTPSSNIGQTAGSYGQAASTLGTPSGAAGPPVFTAPALNWISWSSTRLAPPWQSSLTELHAAFPNLQPRIAYVNFEDLQDRLAAASGTPDSPDVLVSSMPFLRSQVPFVAEATLANLGAPTLDPAEAAGRTLPEPAESLILLRAPHPREARAFIVWLSDQACGACTPQRVPPAAKTPTALAVGAVNTLLSGGTLGAEADPSFAQPSPPLARFLTLQPPRGVALAAIGFRSEVLFSAANDRFAAVALRVIASSGEAFGVLHPLVVLRHGPDGRWRVLQISTDLRGGLLPSVFNTLRPYAVRSVQDRVKPVAGITQAAPTDGDTRSGTPDLWWDNPGDASLLALEWQTLAAGGPSPQWSDSHLSLIPDRGARPQVRVTAPFSQPNTTYRWRVWAVGYGGAMSISSWRRLTLLP